MKKFLIRFSLILLGILPPLIAFEAIVRIHLYIKVGRPLVQSPQDTWDHEIGWPGIESTLGKTSLSPSILVLGDSFTHGLDIPPAQMWYVSISKRFPEEKLVAYGGMGYGTLQELLILNRYLANAKPKLIVLQLCSNDFLNNYLPLERLSFLQRAPAPRPYLEGENIIVRFPRAFDWLVTPAIANLVFANKLEVRLETYLADKASRKELHTVEYDIAEKGYTFPLFRESVTVTKKLLTNFVHAADRIPVIFLLIDDAEPYTDAFRKIADELNIPLINPPHFHTFSKDLKLPDGAHFNAAGNKVMGDSFVELAGVHLDKIDNNPDKSPDESSVYPNKL